eukprot:CAMPEP_0172663384 /NCGR_PEP_ID=MMETSP1074-20121228/5890_1 /TAXON_ID=2916 /ORGANISM="Ceratium fusus, Strain PA161109" /LENGTH=502 /DNA_ID=CAMNT_0013479373 /DNA_START=59 /DNA_END=1563 /DNA_ORIENTATION=-
MSHCVVWHLAWGHVEGQIFNEEDKALLRFNQLKGGSFATTMLGPNLEELAYYGSRAGRDSEMRQWCEKRMVIGDATDQPVMRRVVRKIYGGGPEAVTCLVVGAGARGQTYSEHPALRPMAVAEPNGARRAAFAARHGIALQHQFASWEEAFAAKAAGQFAAEACMVTTPDQGHVAPAIKACNHFGALLLEKPMAVSEDDCKAIVAACRTHGTVCAICHVLRYTFANKQMRHMIAEGKIGEVLSISHTEPVGYFHFAHSFVRGSWRAEEQSTCSLLAKCCHDVDLIASWMNHDTCTMVSSHGSLQHFRRDKKPSEAKGVMRCMDCPVKETCPYSATQLYLPGGAVNHAWARHLVGGPPDIESVAEALKTGPYGRCAYECDNDVCDHQVATFEFASGCIATLTMVATTERMCERETKIYGSLGELSSSCATEVRHTDFQTGQVHAYQAPIGNDQTPLSGHGGADQLLVDAFVNAVRSGDTDLVLTGPEESLRSHCLTFAADRAR